MSDKRDVGVILHRIKINSDPNGLDVFMGGVVVGKTPFSMEIPIKTEGEIQTTEIFVTKLFKKE